MSTLRVQVLIRLLLHGLSKCVTEKTCLLQINGTSIKYILRLNPANTENTAPRWIAGDMVCIPNAFNITKGDKNTLKKKKKKFIFFCPFHPSHLRSLSKSPKFRHVCYRQAFLAQMPQKKKSRVCIWAWPLPTQKESHTY